MLVGPSSGAKEGTVDIWALELTLNKGPGLGVRGGHEVGRHLVEGALEPPEVNNKEV